MFKFGGILLLAAAAAGGFMYFQAPSAPESALTSAQKQRMAIIDKCVDFGDRAIANDQAIVAFQMLERLSKKAGVIERCMADNGYRTNPAWLKYAEPIAKTTAAQDKSSTDEALTTLRRADMQVINPVKNRPDYWITNH